MVSNELGPPKLFTIYKSIDLDPRDDNHEYVYYFFVKKRDVVFWGFSIHKNGFVSIAHDNERYYENKHNNEYVETEIVDSLPKNTNHSKIFNVIFGKDKQARWMM
jgi:hypothetical protein